MKFCLSHSIPQFLEKLESWLEKINTLSIQATLPIHLENTFSIEAMACELILQTALKYKPHGFLPLTFSKDRQTDDINPIWSYNNVSYARSDYSKFKTGVQHTS